MAAESLVIMGRLPALLALVCAPFLPVALPPACTAHIARPLRRHPSAPRRSMMAPSLGFRVRRRSAREHPLLGPQVAVAARRHRRRCRLAEGRSGRGRPAVRRHLRSMGRGGCGGPPPAATAVGGTVGTAGAAALDSRPAAAAGPPRCRSSRLSLSGRGPIIACTSHSTHRYHILFPVDTFRAI